MENNLSIAVFSWPRVCTAHMYMKKSCRKNSETDRVFGISVSLFRTFGGKIMRHLPMKCGTTKIWCRQSAHTQRDSNTTDHKQQRQQPPRQQKRCWFKSKKENAIGTGKKTPNFYAIFAYTHSGTVHIVCTFTCKEQRALNTGHWIHNNNDRRNDTTV